MMSFNRHDFFEYVSPDVTVFAVSGERMLLQDSGRNTIADVPEDEYGDL